MKKLLSILSALLIVLSFAACGQENNTSTTASDSTSSSFVKPTDYATVLLVTINPQFRLYLDADGNVLAVEAVNKDAEDIKENITFENENYEQVIENIITVANENGFIKEDATVKFEIIEDNMEQVETSSAGNSSLGNTSVADTASAADSKEELAAKHNAEILAKAQTAADNTAKNLNIKIDVEVEVKNGSESSELASSAPVSSTEAHTHSFSAATCTQPKKCSCGATEGTALGHSYKDGICTRCKAKDPNYLSPIAKKNGKWTFSKLSGTTLAMVYIDAYTSPNAVSFEKSEAMDSLSDDIKNDANPDDIKTFNGVKYLGMLGDGDVANIVENGKTITVTQGSFKLVLSRTGEDTLKVTETENVPSYFPPVAVGDIFQFTAK